MCWVVFHGGVVFSHERALDPWHMFHLRLNAYALCVLSGFILMTDFCGFLSSLAHQYISHSGELWIQVPALAAIATCAS
jgi:hypothetical protein